MRCLALALLLVGSCSRPKEGPRPVVVFLHGVSPKPDEATADRVRARFRAAGFDVVTPAGRPALCDWAEDVKKSPCWPSDERGVATGRAMVEEWKVRDVAAVVGFSNGGAFTTLIAAHGLLPSCSFVTLHGFPPGEVKPDAAPAPILLVGGRAAPWEPPLLETTTAAFAAKGWPHEAKLLDEGHAVSDADLDAATAFVKARCLKPR